MSKVFPVACISTVFSKEQRREYNEVRSGLETRRMEARELDEGLEFHFSGDSDTLRLLSGWVNLERQCCPFLTFTIVVRHEEERILLQLTGTGEAKAFLLSEFRDQIDRFASLPKYGSI